MKKEIIDILTWVMNRVTEQQQYSKWTDAYSIVVVPIASNRYRSHFIFGDKIIYDGENVNNDIRMGCIAYGIVPKK